MDRKVLRGILIGLDIPTSKVGRSLAISRKDLARLRKKIELHAPELAEASAAG